MERRSVSKVVPTQPALQRSDVGEEREKAKQRNHPVVPRYPARSSIFSNHHRVQVPMPTSTRIGLHRQVTLAHPKVSLRCISNPIQNAEPRHVHFHQLQEHLISAFQRTRHMKNQPPLERTSNLAIPVRLLHVYSLQDLLSLRKTLPRWYQNPPPFSAQLTVKM